MNTAQMRDQAGVPYREDASGTEKYVSFMLAGQEYAADIRRVQEIKGWESVTRMPNVPACILGVVNLRGAIVPVLDLRIRLGLPAAARDASTVIIVVTVPRERSDRTVGIVVDAVADVHDLLLSSIQPPPDIQGADGGFVSGLSNHEGRILVLLDVEKLVHSSLSISMGPETAAC